MTYPGRRRRTCNSVLSRVTSTTHLFHKTEGDCFIDYLLWPCQYLEGEPRAPGPWPIALVWLTDFRLRPAHWTDTGPGYYLDEYDFRLFYALVKTVSLDPVQCPLTAT